MRFSETKPDKSYWIRFAGRRMKVVRYLKKRNSFVNPDEPKVIYYANEVVILEEVTEENK